jgi:hypothetical protein
MQSEKQVRLRFFDVAKSAMLRHLGATGEWKTGSEQCSAWFYCLAEVLKFEREEHETIQSWVTRAYVYHFPEEEEPMHPHPPLDETNYASTQGQINTRAQDPHGESPIRRFRAVSEAADRMRAACNRLTCAALAVETSTGALPRRIRHCAAPGELEAIVYNLDHDAAILNRIHAKAVLEPDFPAGVGDREAFRRGFEAGVKAAESDA